MITIKSLDKSHSTDVVKILIDSFSKNYDKKLMNQYSQVMKLMG